jgi:hypothetical protein
MVLQSTLIRKNILILGHNYKPPYIDVNNQYTQIFDPTKFEVTVAYLTGVADETIEKQHLAENIIFFNMPKSKIRGLKITAIFHLLKLQRKKKFYIVICHRYKPSYIMLWTAFFSKINYLFLIMHGPGTCQPLTRKLLIASLIQKNIFFAGVSNATRDNIRADIWNVPTEQIITLYRTFIPRS